MARVDFSNAVIEFLEKDIFSSSLGYWALNGYGGTFSFALYDIEDNSIATGNTPSAVSSAKGFTVTRTGTFTASGTEFYIRANVGSKRIARISNIVFREGDTYSFDIKVDVP